MHGYPDDVDEQAFLSAFQRLVGAVFRLNGQLLSTAERISDDLIAPSRWQAIATVRDQPVTISQISRRIGVSRQSARQTVQKLVEDGLVTLEHNPDHQRAPLVTLTDSGREIMAELRERQAQLTHDFTDGMGLTVDFLDELTGSLEDLRKHAEELDRQARKKKRE